MVRSNSESDADPRELFHLVEQIRAGEKYFDVSRHQIIRDLASAGGYCEFYSDMEVMDEDTGEVIGAQLRLNIACAAPNSTGWKVAVKLHQTRIDGIDHEARYDTIDGGRASGWHRHHWDAKRKHGRGKLPLEGFGLGLTGREDFLIRAFSELRIVLNSADHGNPGLPFS